MGRRKRSQRAGTRPSFVLLDETSRDIFVSPEKMRELKADPWNLAGRESAEAECTRRQVGCIIVSADGRRSWRGHNRVPAGRPSCLDGGCPRGQRTYDQVPEYADYTSGPGLCHAEHAESMAARLAAASGESMVGALAYVTDEPCDGCNDTLRELGIAAVRWPGGSLTYGIVTEPPAKPVCDGACLTGWDVGLDSGAVAYPDSNCSLHGR